MVPGHGLGVTGTAAREATSRERPLSPSEVGLLSSPGGSLLPVSTDPLKEAGVRLGGRPLRGLGVSPCRRRGDATLGHAASCRTPAPSNTQNASPRAGSGPTTCYSHNLPCGPDYRTKDRDVPDESGWLGPALRQAGAGSGAGWPPRARNRDWTQTRRPVLNHSEASGRCPWKRGPTDR